MYIARFSLVIDLFRFADYILERERIRMKDTVN